MATLRSGSTVGNSRIITEDIASLHRHTTDQIMGLSDIAKGQGEIYAEKIDGYTYADLQTLFVSESNNAMTGSLLVSGTPTSDSAIVSKGATDILFDNLNVNYYDIAQLDPISIPFTNNSLLASNERGYIDPSWTGGPANYPINISVDGPLNDIVSGETRTYIITNYDSFSTYYVNVGVLDTDADPGTIEIVGDTITYTAPDTIKSARWNSISIIQDSGQTKYINLFMEADAPRAFTNQLTMNMLSGNNTTYLKTTFHEHFGFTSMGNVSQMNESVITKHDVDMQYLLSTALDGFRFADIKVLPSGHVIAVGTYDGMNDSTISDHDGPHACIVELDTNNVPIKHRLVITETEFKKVVLDSDGGYIAVGIWNSVFHNSTNALICKFDSGLNVIKSSFVRNTFEGSRVEFNSISEGTDGKYIVAGYSTVESTQQKAGFVTEIDNDLVGARAIFVNSDDNTRESVFNDVLVDDAGNILLCGHAKVDTSRTFDPLYVKLDRFLQPITTKVFRAPSGDQHMFRGMAFSEDDNDIIHMVGSTQALNATYSIQQYLLQYNHVTDVVLKSIVFDDGSDSNIGTLFGITRDPHWGTILSGVFIDSNGNQGSILTDGTNFASLPTTIGTITASDIVSTQIDVPLIRTSDTHGYGVLTTETETITINTYTTTLTSEINSTY